MAATAGSVSPRAFLGLPSGPVLKHFVGLWALVTAQFVIVFAGTDYVTARHNWRIRAYVDAELEIPLIPLMVVAYMSVYLGVLIAPFVLRTRQELERLAGAVARTILVAGVAFVLLPAELGYPPVGQTLAGIDPAVDSVWINLLAFADLINLDYNLIPSLHVALFVTCLGVYAVYAGTLVRAVLAVWMIAVAASTVLTHQHHLVDVVAGVALGIWGAANALISRDHLLTSG